MTHHPAGTAITNALQNPLQAAQSLASTLVGDLTMAGTRTITIPRGTALTELAAGAVVAQHIAVRIARARGIEPGAFAYGQKVTTTL